MRDETPIRPITDDQIDRLRSLVDLEKIAYFLGFDALGDFAFEHFATEAAELGIDLDLIDAARDAARDAAGDSVLLSLSYVVNDVSHEMKRRRHVAMGRQP